MKLGVVKIELDWDEFAPLLPSDLAKLSARLRQKFKVVCKAEPMQSDRGPYELVVADLGLNGGELNGKLESIVTFCDQAGFARVSDHSIIIDELDSIFEEWASD